VTDSGAEFKYMHDYLWAQKAVSYCLYTHMNTHVHMHAHTGIQTAVTTGTASLAVGCLSTRFVASEVNQLKARETDIISVS
jgi:hypothetical protein